MKKNEQKRSQVSSPSPKRKSAQKSRNPPPASKSPVQKSQESPAPVVEPTKGGFALASDDDEPNTKVHEQKKQEAADEYSDDNYSDN